MESEAEQIDLPDFEPEHFLPLLEYIYTGIWVFSI